MIRLSAWHHLLARILVLTALLTALPAAEDRRRFSTPPSLAAEASTLAKLLDELHYNRDAVRSSDYVNVIPDYMEELDGQRLFFLGTDRAEIRGGFRAQRLLQHRVPGQHQRRLRDLLRLSERVQTRIAWIFEQLKGDFDFTSGRPLPADRSKAEWPADPASSDELWQKRLKFELLGEVLNKKTIEEAKEKVKKRYERMLKNLSPRSKATTSRKCYLSTIARLYDPHSTYFSAEPTRTSASR
jgi:carboxyl-terminal processing protease